MPNGERPEMLAAMMAQAAMQKEVEEQRREAYLEKVNEILRELPPDLMIERLKSVLYRNAGILECWQKSAEANAGQDMLANSLYQMTTAVGEAIKWIANHNELDPYEPYGDDSHVLRVQDIVLGIDLDEQFEEDDDQPMVRRVILDQSPRPKYDPSGGAEQGEDREL